MKMKGVVLEDVMNPAADESNQQEHSSENYISMKQIHMNYLSEVRSNTESDKPIMILHYMMNSNGIRKKSWNTTEKI